MGKGLTQDLKEHIAVHGKDCGGVSALISTSAPKQKRATKVVTAKSKAPAMKSKVDAKKIKSTLGNTITSKREYFKAHGNIGFGEVKSLVAKSGFSIERTPYNNRKFVLTDKDNVQHLFNWAPHVKLLHEKISDLGIDSFLKKYEIKSGANIVDQKTTERKPSKRQIKLEQRQNSSRIDEINTRITDITLEIMHYTTKRGSDKHMKLREEMKALHEERRNLGFEKIANGALTKEEMDLAKKRGQEKRKERKAQREMKKKGIGRE